jgi:5-carboxyvanillate decarboxylase
LNQKFWKGCMSKTGKTRVIAVEEHFVTGDYFSNAGALAVPNGEEPERAFVTNFPKNEQMLRRFTNMQVRLDEMDSAGVDLSVLTLNPPGVQMFTDAVKATALAIEANDRLAEIIQQYPARFYGLGSVGPQDSDAAAREIKRIMGPLKLGGVMIASHTHGCYLDQPEFEPMLAALEEENATLYLHPRSPSPQMIDPFMKYGMVAAVWGFQAEAATHAMRLIMGGVFDRHPHLKVVLGHLGEALPFWLWRLDNIYKRTYEWAGKALKMVKLELKPSEYILRNFAVTTSGMSDPDVLAYCVGKLGAERILFAIDYPYEDSQTAVEFLTQATLTEHQRELISHGNAELLFRVPRQKGRPEGPQSQVPISL